MKIIKNSLPLIFIFKCLFEKLLVKILMLIIFIFVKQEILQIPGSQLIVILKSKKEMEKCNCILLAKSNK